MTLYCRYSHHYIHAHKSMGVAINEKYEPTTKDTDLILKKVIRASHLIHFDGVKKDTTGIHLYLYLFCFLFYGYHPLLHLVLHMMAYLM
jgi:hypothetical protein